ncbi:hypothetical protein [Emticicia sp. 17c]
MKNLLLITPTPREGHLSPPMRSRRNRYFNQPVSLSVQLLFNCQS